MSETPKRKRLRYYVCAIELDSETPIGKKTTLMNPLRDPSKPLVWIESLISPPEILYIDGTFEKSETSRVRNYGQRIVPEYRTSHSRWWGVLSKRENLANDLRNAGWCVLNPAPQNSHSVYVIELKREALAVASVEKANPDADRLKSCLYVGQTSHTPEGRFQQHMAGVHASTYVKRFGLRLALQYLRRSNPMTERESFIEENGLAKALRAKGHAVMGGH